MEEEKCKLEKEREMEARMKRKAGKVKIHRFSLVKSLPSDLLRLVFSFCLNIDTFLFFFLFRISFDL